MRKASSPPTGAERAGGALARAVLVVLCALCAAVAVAGTAAAAPPTPAGTFDGSGTPAGSFGSGVVWKVAVDEASGDVYVLDVGNDVVDRFGSDGTYISQLRGSDTTPRTFGFTGNGLDDIAVDNSGGPNQGHLYVLSRAANTIFAYDASGNELYEAPGLAGRTCGLAVDPAGFLWAADRDSTDLSQLRPGDGAPTGTTITMDGFDRCHIAFDNEAAVYVGGFFDSFEKYDGVNPTVSIDPAPNTTYAVATSFRRNDVFSVALDFGIPGPAIDQWDKSGSMISQVRGTGGTNDFEGVAINGATGKLYVADIAAGVVRTYDVPAQQPTVILSAGTNVAKTTTTLNGTVNPNGSDVTDCHFEYGTFSSGRFDSQAPCVPATPISGTSSVAVRADIRGLTPGTQYQYRLVATNSGGTTTPLSPVLFRTLPTRLPIVTTTVATGIAETGATLNGRVNPNGSATSCVFQYGTTASYGSEVAVASPGSSNSEVSVSAAAAGLTAGTPYHFRLACRNADGTTNGSDASFTTTTPVVRTCQSDASLCPPPPPPPPAVAVLRLSGTPLAKVVGSTATVGVTCTGDQGATCRGSLTFRGKVTVKVKRGRRTVVKRKTITVGTATYDLAVGSGGSLRITLTSAAKKALKRSALLVTADGLDHAVKIPKARKKRRRKK